MMYFRNNFIKIIFFVGLSLGAFSKSDAVIEYDIKNKHYIPFKIGINFAGAIFQDQNILHPYTANRQDLIGINVGVGYEYVFFQFYSGALSFGIDFLYSNKGVRLQQDQGYNFGGIPVSLDVYLHYISFPLLLYYNITIFRYVLAYLFIGPSFNFRVSQSIESSNSAVSVDASNSFNLFDVGIKVGLGIIFNSILLELVYEYGFLDFISNDSLLAGNTYHSVISLSVGRKNGF